MNTNGNRNRNASLLPHWAYLRTHLLGLVLSTPYSANILDLLAHRQGTKWNVMV